jgi:chemotaxis regulatin CheY-phosphate phosphatase CheZ
MHDIQNLLNTIQSIKVAPEKRKIQSFDKISPILEKLLMNISVFLEILEGFIEEKSEGISNQIKAIDGRSEIGANKILDAALVISENLSDIPETQKKNIERSINEIYEGCNFQDLISQHAHEIDHMIQFFTEELIYLKEIMSDPSSGGGFQRPVRDSNAESHLLNGPSTEI